MDTLSRRLQWALSQKPGATQADLARACKVKAPSVAGWFSGKTKSLKAESLRLAAAYLGVSRDWLESGSGPPNYKYLDAPVPGFDVVRESLSPKQVDVLRAEFEALRRAAPPKLSPSDTIVRLGEIIADADAVSKAALPGLFSALVDHPGNAPQIGRQFEALLAAGRP